MSLKKTRLDKVLAVDFEMTCWEEGPSPERLPEIIDVGLVEISTENLTITRSDRFFVRPKWSSVSEYCTRLTGITNENLRRHGRPLPEVANALKRKWGSGSKLWMAWGRDDIVIERDCVKHEIENPFSRAFRNLGLECTIDSGQTENAGLHRVMGEMGLEPGRGRHTALNDAMGLAHVWIARTRSMRQGSECGIQYSSNHL
ncbi:3'-5' exonuclease [Roseibium sp. RKSG952]|uniref:3'-5' exonuclease n=1 Tax=Roseibium sp. RKSG952 TaxID=2529384 RepID=UPI0018AD17E3|nr:3'-5' exonuclease [Roseibium sp. RKSG952]